jgi:hypothetical protein
MVLFAWLVDKWIGGYLESRGTHKAVIKEAVAWTFEEGVVGSVDGLDPQKGMRR